MRALCERAYATFAEEARGRGIEYDLALGREPVLITDGDRVLQIVTNLLANALHWTPAADASTSGSPPKNGEVSVAVADTGPGVAPQEEERIFRPFMSGDGAGTGLGLTIARELALALGGRLELHSEPGRGSRFVLALPVRRLSRRSTLVEAIDDGAVARQPLLELRQPLLDAPPARGDEVDEQGEVVDARVPLGEDVSLDPLEPADDLVRQAAYLGEMTGARPEVLAKPVLDRLGQARFERAVVAARDSTAAAPVPTLRRTRPGPCGRRPRPRSAAVRGLSRPCPRARR